MTEALPDMAENESEQRHRDPYWDCDACVLFHHACASESG
jgi:hypothetical protein